MLQNKQNRLRRRAVRLLLLIAALFALSPTAAAYDAASIQGYYNNIGLSSLGEWTYTSITKTDNNNYYYDLTPTAAGTAYIKFKLNENKFKPISSGVLPTAEPASDNAQTDNSEGEWNFTVSSENVNKTHRIHIYTGNDWQKAKIWITVENGSGGGGGSSTTWYLHYGTGDDWKDFDFTGTPLMAKISNWNSNYEFGVKDKNDDGSWYVNGSANITSESQQTLNGSGNMSLDSSSNGKEVTFTLDASDANSLKLTPSWSSGGSGGDEGDYEHNPGTGWAIIGDWTGFGKDWTKGDAMTSNKTYSIVAKDTEDIYFRVKNGSTEYYPSENNNIKLTAGKYQWCTQVSETNNQKAFYFTPKQGYQYEVVVESCSDNTAGYRICVNDKGLYVPPVPEVLPVFPIGVNNEEELSTYTDPVYYLLGSVINNGYITPEYQFVKAGDDYAKINNTYSGANVSAESLVLEFTIHNTSSLVEGASTDGFSVVGYATPDSKGVSILEKIAWNNLSSKNAHRAGNACVAVFDPDAKTCHFYLKENGQQPFISLIGKEWKQNTITNGEEPFTTHRGNTDDGWQEAWIQYTEGGTIAKDREGKVMYNTQFPPKNPIKFKTVFKLNETDYDFTVDSDDLVFVPTGVTKTGAQWKADTDTFQEIGDGTVSTSQLHKDNEGTLADMSGKKYFENTLALDDSRNYALYRVDNVWINGDVKLWSGWTAGNYGTAANWSNHANWGHFEESTSATGIAASSSVPLSNQKGDVAFGQPTYFKSIYFFLDTEKGYDPKYSVLFSELAYGGAEIAALNNTDYTHGYFRPALSDLSNVADGKVQKVKIDCYTDDRETFMSTVFNDQSVEDTKNTDFHTLFANHHTSDMGDVESTATSSKAKWLYDGNSYPNGNYRYKMEVTFTDNNQNSHTVVVWSNPFTIFRREASATLKAYQLVKVLGPTDGYNYLTYDPAGGNKVYKVKVTVEKPNNVIGGVDSTSDEEALNSDINPKYVESKELDASEIATLNFGDGSKYRFSCKVLLVGDIVGQNITKYELVEPLISNIEKYIEGDRVEKDNVPTFIKNEQDQSYRFFYVVEPLIEKNGFKYGYTWNPSFKYWFKDANNIEQEKSGTSVATVEGNLVLPEPKLIEEHSRLEMFYGGDDRESTDNQTRDFSYNVSDDNAVELGAGARFQQVRKAIVIERPNVTLRYRALSKNYIVAKAKEAGIDVGYTDNKKAPLVVGLFDFKVGDETVVINNGSKYPNSEGLDWYLYHSATKNPADYYFKGLREFNYLWDPKDNIGVTTYYEPREMTFSVRDAFKDVKFFPRWESGVISGLRISQDAPVNALYGKTYDDAVGTSEGDNAVRITGSSLIYAEAPAEGIKAGDLIERVTVKVNLASETGNVVARVDEEGNPLKETGEVAEDYREAGKEMQHTDFITTGNDAQAAADTESDEKGTTDYFLVRIVDKTTQKDLMTPQAVSAKDMYDGKEFAVTANHGHWWDGQLETVKSDALYKRIQVRISHLYPFVAGTEGTTVDTTTPASAPRRAAAEEATASDESVVIKSDAMLREFAGNDIPTAVIGVEDAMRDSVVTGVGFIEAHGEGVEIYGADGIKVAVGEGRHEVSAGVYVVRLNGRAEKVIVR